MRVIRELAEHGNVGIVRSELYSKRVSHILTLVAEAKKDFPSLSDDDMEVVYYGGDRYKRTYGVEFNVPNGENIPDTYKRIHQLEFTL